MLFKHGYQKKPEKIEEKKNNEVVSKPAEEITVDVPAPKPPKDVSPEALRELLEKNLKWSQIIYEQNRKINSKLFWTAFANWTRLVIMLAAFGAAAWFLPPIVASAIQRYNQILSDPTSLLKGMGSGGSAANTQVGDLCDFLPADMQQSCKAITSKK